MAIEKSCTVQMTFEDCRANEGADIVKFSTTLWCVAVYLIRKLLNLTTLLLWMLWKSGNLIYAGNRNLGKVRNFYIC